MSTLEVRYDATLEDQHAFNRHHARHSSVARRARQVSRLWLTAFLAVLLGVLGFSIRAPLPFWVMGAGLIAAWWFLFPRRMDQMSRRHTQRMYASARNEDLLGAHQVVLEPAWLVEKTALREVRTHWRAVESVAASDEHLFLYTSAFSAVIVPWRAFSTPDEGQAFARACEDRLKAARAEP